MGKKKSRKPAMRSHKIPAAAQTTGKALMDAQAAATTRYNEWALDTIAAMSIGDPKEGHLWLVDPSKGSVVETRK